MSLAQLELLAQPGLLEQPVRLELLELLALLGLLELPVPSD